MPNFEVPIVYRGLSNFIVNAETPEAARELAIARFNDGDTPELLGNEWEEIDRVGEITIVKELIVPNNTQEQ